MKFFQKYALKYQNFLLYYKMTSFINQKQDRHLGAHGVRAAAIR
jgi:hypothetical protein